MVSAGDNYQPGPQLNASIKQDGPFFDAIAMGLVGYDAIGLGNQDFDFGPDVLAYFIQSFETPVPFLSTNLDVTAEPRLAALRESERLSTAIVLEVDGESIGLIGVVSPQLLFVFSPRNVVVDPNTASAVQEEVDLLESQGINKIILQSDLHSI